MEKETKFLLWTAFLKQIKIFFSIIIIFFLIGTILFFVRIMNHAEVDDVHPSIQCNLNLIENSKILWVIPLYNNQKISDNPEWCKYILSLNKTLGMHGVYHSYEEFGIKREAEYLERGIDEFEACFGFRPYIFKAPQLKLNWKNKIVLDNYGFSIYGKINQLLHKVYHCEDSGFFNNDFINKF